MEFKYLLKIFIVSFLVLSVILFINITGITLKDVNIQKELQNVVKMESFENNVLTLNLSNAFCEKNKGFTLERACNELTKDNCNLTSCCVWMSDNKCKAGNKSGPLFNSGSNGKTNLLDYYYFQNKCYGEKC